MIPVMGEMDLASVQLVMIVTRNASVRNESVRNVTGSGIGSARKRTQGRNASATRLVGGGAVDPDRVIGGGGQLAYTTHLIFENASWPSQESLTETT